MKVLFSGPVDVSSGTVVIFAFDQCKLGVRGKNVDRKIGGAVSSAMKSSKFQGKLGQCISILAPANIKLDRIVVFGLGKERNLDRNGLELLGSKVFQQLDTDQIKTAVLYIEDINNKEVNIDDSGPQIAFGAKLSSYRFEKYKNLRKSETQTRPKSITIQLKKANKAREKFKILDKIVDGVFLTRDLVSEPANILYPESLANRCKSLTKLGIKVEILSKAQMQKKGMGALLGVAQGSIREPRMVIMEWNGAKNTSKKKQVHPIAFVGKGVTFDTGGISLKPAGGMEDMKWDMGGAGVVIGLMSALAGRKAKINAVGVIGLVENMPGGNAQRPGDVVSSMSGKTIEVLNTDAEGRLVLADALHYTNERFEPKFMINLATLTGAIIIALGNEHAGMFSNNDQLSARLAECGNEIGEKVWRMPLSKAYDKMIDCDIADMKNISGGRGAGSITAAQFLQRFVGNTPWAHLDIAGVTWSSKSRPTVPKGGTAFGVRLLERLVKKYYEGK